MLHQVRFKNFFSFQDESELSLIVNKHVPDSGLVSTTVDGVRLSKAMAVIGPNASGKTHAIKVVPFLAWFTSASFRSKPDAKIAFFPHFFSSKEPSEFELIFDNGKSIWRYELEITTERVNREALYKKTSRSFSYVFVREWTGSDYAIKSQGFDLSAKEARRVRQNVSLISHAAQYGSEVALGLGKLPLITNVHIHGRQKEGEFSIYDAADFYSDSPSHLSEAVELLKKWDFGLVDVKIEEREIATEDGQTEKINIPVCLHKHGNKTVKLAMIQESSGTQRAFTLLADILPILRTGGLAVIDELEADMHPHMIDQLLDLFFSKKSNPRDAQIVFTCHAAEVLNQLHKSQVQLVEKSDSSSETWRLDSMKGLRADDNLYSKYMAGAYGAIPEV